MIDKRHLLAVPTTRMPWVAMEASLASVLAQAYPCGRMAQDVELFGPAARLAGAGPSNAGRPGLAVRLMVALLYLRHAFKLSDEELCQRWSKSVFWQFFSGMEYYAPRLPCDATQICRFRRVLSEAGAEQLLKSTIEASASMGAVKKTEFEMIIVDTMVHLIGEESQQAGAVARKTGARRQERRASDAGWYSR